MTLSILSMDRTYPPYGTEPAHIPVLIPDTVRDVPSAAAIRTACTTSASSSGTSSLSAWPLIFDSSIR